MSHSAHVAPKANVAAGPQLGKADTASQAHPLATKHRRNWDAQLQTSRNARNLTAASRRSR